MDPIDRFRLVAHAARTDGQIGDAERAVLRRAGAEFGLTAKQLDTVLSEVERGAHVDVAVPSDPRNRSVLFRQIVDVVAADGEIDGAELAFVQRLGPKFGLNELEVEDLLRSAAAAAKGKARKK